MLPKTRKYILNIERAIDEIDLLVSICENDFNQFENNPLAIRSLEIIGEATRKAVVSDSTLHIENATRIIALRNRLAHAYDSIENGVIWSIAVKNIPKLSTELKLLK